jgi:hypothetical protein
MVESFIDRFRDECLNEEVFASLTEARAVTIGRSEPPYDRSALRSEADTH